MHGSMGGGRKPAPVGQSARSQAPLAYPTNLAGRDFSKRLAPRRKRKRSSSAPCVRTDGSPRRRRGCDYRASAIAGVRTREGRLPSDSPPAGPSVTSARQLPTTVGEVPRFPESRARRAQTRDFRERSVPRPQSRPGLRGEQGGRRLRVHRSIRVTRSGAARSRRGSTSAGTGSSAISTRPRGTRRTATRNVAAMTAAMM